MHQMLLIIPPNIMPIIGLWNWQRWSMIHRGKPVAFAAYKFYLWSYNTSLLKFLLDPIITLRSWNGYRSLFTTKRLQMQLGEVGYIASIWWTHQRIHRGRWEFSWAMVAWIQPTVNLFQMRTSISAGF